MGRSLGAAFSVALYRISSRAKALGPANDYLKKQHELSRGIACT